jgi:chromosome partitioning protein
MPEIIVVTNRKGGSGKTTTAINLAAEFAAREQRVLLIDLDTQGHCAIGLGVQRDDSQPSVHGFFLEGSPEALRAAIVATPCKGLELAAADTEFDHDRVPHQDDILRNALAAPDIQARYDRILIDCPPSLDRLLLNALTAANWAMIPFLPHPLAAEGARALARVFFRVAMSTNAELRLLGLLPIMLDRRIGQHKRVLEQLGSQFGPERIFNGIRNDIKLAEAFAAGQPVRNHAPRSRGRADYRALTDLLEERLAPA